MVRTITYNTETESDILSFLKGKEQYSARLITALRKSPEGILLNGKPARTTARFRQGDVLCVNIPLGESDISPVALPLEVVYEDEDVLVVNKPAFLVCHPTRNHQGDTLANAVAYYLEQKGKRCTFRAVNRLDRDTTGLVLIALHRFAADRLRHTTEKTYYALAEGILEQGGTIDLPIERVEARKITRRVGANGQRAVTRYKVLEQRENATLLEIQLETGRTHQIRVHFAAIGHPLVGDTMYGTAKESSAHQCLHCGKICFVHPVTKQQVEVDSCPPFMETGCL